MQKTLIDQYNNSTTQNLMRQYLQNLKLSTIMENENCDVTYVIEKIRHTINKYTPLGPKSHCTDSPEKEYLYGTDVEYSWASSALTNFYTATPACDFDRLCTNSAAWLQEQRRTVAQSLTSQN